MDHEVLRPELRDLVHRGAGLGADPRHPAAGIGHLANFLARRRQSRQKDRLRPSCRASLLAGLLFLLDPDLDARDRVPRISALVQRGLHSRFERRPVRVPDGDVRSALGPTLGLKHKDQCFETARVKKIAPMLRSQAPTPNLKYELSLHAINRHYEGRLISQDSVLLRLAKMRCELALKEGGIK
jgi:hypothetical protein